MATNTTEPVESEKVTNEETPQDNISDRRLILGPLLMYGVVAFVIAGVIVTTAVMLNNEYNQIDKQVAAVEAEIAQQNQMEAHAEQKAIVDVKNTEVISAEVISAIETEQAKEETEAIETTNVIASNAETNPAAALPEENSPIATSSAEPATVVSATAASTTIASETKTPSTVTATPQIADKIFDPKVSIATRRAEHHELMVKQDQKQLELFKASQARQIEWLRNQLAQQQERIDTIEERNLKTYEMREADVKRMQETREQFLNRM